jgi:hypothetical protein
MGNITSRVSQAGSKGLAETPSSAEMVEEKQEDYYDSVAQVHLPRML